MMKLAPHLEVHDERFRRYVHKTSTLERIATGFTWTEGPVWFGDHDCLLFSDIPNQRILRWSDASGVTVYRQPSGFNNGNTRDRRGRLVGCRHGFRDVARTEPDGSVTVLADSFEGRRLNSPNDVVVSADGAVWFTDPTYGIVSNFEGYRAEPEQPCRNVFRIAPDTGDIAAVVTDFAQPNGLCFSPDETRLYIADSGMSHDAKVPPAVRVYRVEPDGRLSGGREFCRLGAGFPDGIRCDIEGNLWSSALDGVHCFAPDGTLLGKILVPERVSNLAFGGPDGQRLFITATSSVYRVFIDVKGAEPWTHGH